jgi:aspartate/methionine/tyrosine aminotransferase
LHENVLAVKVDGATKEEFAWGLRVGFITIGSKGITDEIVLCNREQDHWNHNEDNYQMSPKLSQSLILNELKSKSHEDEKREKFLMMEKRYCEVKEFFENNKSKYFSPLPFNSGYFMCLEFK